MAATAAKLQITLVIKYKDGVDAKGINGGTREGISKKAYIGEDDS